MTEEHKEKETGKVSQEQQWGAELFRGLLRTLGVHSGNARL